MFFNVVLAAAAAATAAAAAAAAGQTDVLAPNSTVYFKQQSSLQSGSTRRPCACAVLA